jgi:2-oxoglutarate dehydrogenase E2 component (dihydrolipoamide succinyltransferase)
MTPLRRKLSQRLVAVKNDTAMLTTFNEVDMSKIMDLRTRFQKAFTEKYGYKLGFNAFFAKAVSQALLQHPSINSMIDGEEIVTPKYHDIGIAVSSPKGLMVPIIRNVEMMNVAQIEGSIKDLAEKARDKRLTVQEMTGGTFTITNGGVFGSMMSTPIINPPQSAILGLHAIKDRPVAIEGKVEIRPMMYIALSYDHRIIDGKDSVGFLVKIKELIENPNNLLFNGKDVGEVLLDL